MKRLLVLLAAIPLAVCAQTFRAEDHSFRIVKVVEGLENPGASRSCRMGGC
jgi:hypothetical protein